MRVIFLFLTILIVPSLAGKISSLSADSRNGTDEDNANVIVERGSDLVDKALVPVYDMVNFFLGDIIQQNDLTYMQEKGVDFSDSDSVLNSFRNDYEEWIWYFIGYAVLVAIGIVMILVMSCAACCTCLCRTCCGKCGGKVQPIPTPESGESNPGRYKRISCGISLFIVITLVFLGSLTMYFTAVRIHSELSATDDGLFNSVSGGLTMIDNYVNNTLQDLESGTLDTYSSTVDQVFNTLEGVVQKSYDQLDTEAGISRNMEPLLYFSGNMQFMSNALGNVESNITDLQRKVNDVDTELTTIKLNIETAINNACPTDPDCNRMVEQVNNVTVADYSGISGTFVPFIAVLNRTAGLNDGLSAGYNEFTAIVKDVNDTVFEEIQVARQQADEVGNVIQTEIDNIQDELDSISFNGTIEDIQEIADNIKEPTDFAFYGMAGLAGLLLLIVVFGYLGLLFGCFCSQPRRRSDSCCCTKKIGATCLLAGVGFTFLFFSLLMLILIVLMLSGGLLQTEMCQHLVSPDQSPVMSIIDDVMNDTLFADAGFYINITEIYVNCRNDMAFYTALNVEETFDFNLNTILDVSAIKNEIAKIRNESVDFGTVNILSPAAMTALELLATEVDGAKVTVQDAMEALGKDVTTEDLRDLADDLVDLDADQGGITGLSVEISRLRSLKNDTEEIDEQKSITVDELSQVNDILGATNLTEGIIGLEIGNATVNANGAAIVDGVIDQTTYEVEGFVDNGVDDIDQSVRYDIGKCAPVYNAYSTLVDSGCVELLYPLNGYWFALGWSLFFLIVGLIMSLKLATLYRQVYTHRHAVHPSPANYEQVLNSISGMKV